MTSTELLALADDFRWFAVQTGRDLNAANMFVHNMLMRTLLHESAAFREEADELDDYDFDEPRAA